MEEEIYNMIEDGYTVEDIADELGISEEDVMDIIENGDEDEEDYDEDYEDYDDYEDYEDYDNYEDYEDEFYDEDYYY